MTFAATLRRIRIAAELTQQELADGCDVSHQYISLIEAGDRDPVTHGVIFLRDAAAVLKVEPSVLLDAIEKGESDDN